MINYIRSEIYRSLRDKANYFFILGIMAFVIFLNFVLWVFSKSDVGFPYGTTKFSFSNLYGGLEIVLVLCVFAVGIIFAQEYKNQTLKNAISFGIPRSTIYFGKFILSVIYSLIISILVIATFVISAYMLLENSGIEHLNLLISSFIVASPLFIFSLTVAHCCYFIMDKELNIIGVFITIILIIPGILESIGRKSEIVATISNFMPFNILGDITFNEITETLVLGWTTPEAIIKSIFIGVIGSVTFYFIGLRIFKRKEIK